MLPADNRNQSSVSPLNTRGTKRLAPLERKSTEVAIPGTELRYEDISYRTRKRIERSRKSPPAGWPDPNFAEPLRASMLQRERQRRIGFAGGIAVSLVVLGTVVSSAFSPGPTGPVTAVLDRTVERSELDTTTTTTTTTTTVVAPASATGPVPQLIVG